MSSIQPNRITDYATAVGLEIIIAFAASVAKSGGGTVGGGGVIIAAFLCGRRHSVCRSVSSDLSVGGVHSSGATDVVMRSFVIQSGHGSSPAHKNTRPSDIQSVGDVTFEVVGGGNNASAAD